MNVEVLYNNPFHSTSNVLSTDNPSGYSWIVDCGNAEEVIEILHVKNLSPKGIFLTHAHFDHIYGLNDLINCFPEVNVYTSAIGFEMIQNARKNMSHYWGKPIVLDKLDNVLVVKDHSEVTLYNRFVAKAVFTPGHNPSCITWIIGDYIFTGDSYIPGVKTVTNLPGGNKLQAQQSLELIKRLAVGRKIYPGHVI